MSNEKYQKPTTHKVNLTHDGEIIGEGEITEDGTIWKGSLTAEGVKKVFPGYDPTKGLSIAVDRPEVTPWDSRWNESLSQFITEDDPTDLRPSDVKALQSYSTLREAQQKGTFDA